MGLELLFIGDVEDRLQLVPIVLLSAGLVALAWHTLRPTCGSARGVRLLMALFVAAVSALACTIAATRSSS